MGFLAPLYAVAALTIAAPIVFHFIVRRPRGTITFSSIMFLRQSAPRLTNRSRPTDLLLLLLRAAALIVLAAAFMRPFLQSDAAITVSVGRHVVLLVDTSASMQRETLWDQALQRVQSIVDRLDDQDLLSVYRFDHTSEPVVVRMPVATARSTVLPALRQLKPTDGDSQLGLALIAAADRSADLLVSDPSLHIVLVSDMQSGSDLTALQRYRWPSEVPVHLETVLPDNRDNASVSVLPSRLETATSTDEAENKLRLLVVNHSTQAVATLEIACHPWDMTRDQPRVRDTNESMSVQVPADGRRVIPWDVPTEPVVFELSGDQVDFDNRFYYAGVPIPDHQLIYIDPLRSSSTDQIDAAYFLRQLDLRLADRNVEIVFDDDAGQIPSLDGNKVALVVLADVPDTAWMPQLKRYISDGGRLLLLLQQSMLDDPNAPVRLASLLDLPDLQLTDKTADSYFLLADLEFQDELFRGMGEPRFSDFSKIRFFRHTQLDTSQQDAWRVVAEFDDGQPAICRRTIGNGTVWLWTSSWHPPESQMALSTKFVPLLVNSLKPLDTDGGRTQIEVYVPWNLPSQHAAAQIVDSRGNILRKSSDAIAPLVAEKAGFLQLETPQKPPTTIAVNIASAESRTSALTPDAFRQAGIPTRAISDQPETHDVEQQLVASQLESNQSIWRWLIAVAAVLVISETFMASRDANSTLQAEGTA